MFLTKKTSASFKDGVQNRASSVGKKHLSKWQEIQIYISTITNINEC